MTHTDNMTIENAFIFSIDFVLWSSIYLAYLMALF